MKNSALTIRLPKEIKKELENLAKEEKTHISELIRESLDHFLAVRRFRQLRRKTLPFAEAQGLLTDEDVFKIIS
jgi:predicted transcriptional regulator